MAGTISNYLENKWLDHTLKTAAFTQPTYIYVGLSTANPLDDGSGLAEPSGNGYARVQFDTWNAAASRAITNNGDITFPAATGAGWGSCTHVVFFDASSGGNILGSGSLAVAKTPANGDVVVLGSGLVSISCTTGFFSNYLANKLLDHTFKVASFTQPTNVYLAACTSAPSDSSTGSTITEASGGSYARTANNTWDAASGGATSNTNDVSFPTATADWSAAVSHVALVDASSAGNMLIYGALTASKTVLNGDTLRWLAGTFDMSID